MQTTSALKFVVKDSNTAFTRHEHVTEKTWLEILGKNQLFADSRGVTTSYWILSRQWILWVAAAATQINPIFERGTGRKSNRSYFYKNWNFPIVH